jgi:hypothetical protein
MRSDPQQEEHRDPAEHEVVDDRLEQREHVQRAESSARVEDLPGGERHRPAEEDHDQHDREPREQPGQAHPAPADAGAGVDLVHDPHHLAAHLPQRPVREAGGDPVLQHGRGATHGRPVQALEAARGGRVVAVVLGARGGRRGAGRGTGHGAEGR